MSWRCDEEESVAMPACSTRGLELLGEEILRDLEPEHLQYPRALDVLAWAEHKLQRFNYHVIPVSKEELSFYNCVGGMADQRGRPGDPIELLIDERYYDALVEEGGPDLNYARALVPHEFAHGVLHVPVFRKYALKEKDAFPLKRKPLKEIKTYQRPEWQAWALTGAILVPRKTLEMLPPGTERYEIADIYQVSKDLLDNHLRRLKLEERYPEDTYRF